MRKVVWLLILVSAGIFFGSIWHIGSTTTPANPRLSQEDTTSVRPRSPGTLGWWDEAMKSLVLVARTHNGGFGSVLMLDGTLTNNSRLDIRDPQITCELVAPSGTSFGHVSTTLYEQVAPGKTLQIKNVNFGFVHNQASGVGCQVTNLRAFEVPPPEPKAAPVKSTKSKQAKAAAK